MHHPRHSLLRAWSLGLVWLILIAACGQTVSPTPTVAEAQATLQLHWVHDYSSTGFYAAAKNGHYTSEGLNVTIKAGGFDDNGYIDATTQVANGSADFGIASADSIIQARAQGKPVVGIAAIFQRSPLAIISLADAQIQKPTDLIGKRITMADGGATQLYNTMLRINQIDPTKITATPRTSSGITPLMDDSADAMVAWAINEGVEVEEAGKEPTIMLMSDYGIDSYELVLLTSETMIRDHPDVVRRFLKATVQGWNDVIANPNEMVSLVHAYDPALELEGQRSRLQATLPLLSLPGTAFGTMNPEYWAFTHQMLLDQKALAQPIDLERAYTLEFLQEIPMP